MVAEVYPIKRLPRRFNVFDYAIPDSLALKRGNFVLIPWRNRMIWGVVARVKEKPVRDIKLKAISQVMPEVALSEQEVVFYEQVAFDLVQSVGSILHAAWPKIPKKAREYAKPSGASYQLTLPKKEIANMQDILAKMDQAPNGFVFASDLRRAAVVIAGRAPDPGQTNLVICANVRDAELLAAGLNHLQPILVTGQETPIARWQGWKAWRERGGLFIGTRLSALLLHPDISNIFIIRSGQANHKQADRNPRYDTRRLAKLIGELWPAKLWHLDVTPRVDDLAHLSGFFGSPNPLPVAIVETQKEKITAPHPAIGSSTVRLIEEALINNRKVIAIYNRKGVARQLKCKDCGHNFPCENCAGQLLVYEHTMHCHRCGGGQPIPLQCPHCRGADLWHKGFGNRMMARSLQKLFPQSFVGLIEKDNFLGSHKTADIAVVTNYYLEHVFNPFVNDKVGLVVDLDADMALYEPSFRGLEQALINFDEWRGLARAYGARFAIQTDSAEIFRQYLENPRTSLEKELAMRREFDQPPKKRWIRIKAKDMDRRQVEVDMALLKKKLHKADAEAAFLFQKKDLVMEAGFEPKLSEKIFFELAKLDDSYIIDSNVNV